MEVLRYKIQVKTPETPVYIDFFSDIHIGPKNFSKTAFERALKESEKAGAFFIGGGDYCDSIIPTDKRYDREDVTKEEFEYNGVKWDMGSLDGQYALLEKYLEPIAKRGKLLGLGIGNHGSKVFILMTCNLVKGIAARLKTKYLGYISYLTIEIWCRGKKLREVKTLAWHGHGGGTSPGAVVGIHEKLRKSFDADLYLTGHWHQPMTFSRVRLDSDGKKTVGKVAWHGSSGSFLRSYVPGVEGYAERNAYEPLSLGFLRTKILPKKGVVGIEFINCDQME